MKSKRHAALIDIINRNSIETQDELTAMLNKIGFEVTQATISRDIRELKITKSLGEDGRYIYMFKDSDSDGHRHALYGDTLARSLRSIEYASNIVVIKTYPGLAGAVAAGVDAKKTEGVLGCVAGDDTIIVATKNEDVAKSFTEDMILSSGLK